MMKSDNMMKPDKIEELDHLRKQLADSELARAQESLSAAMARRQLVCSDIAAKYSFGVGDGYDPQTLAITRAAKPEEKPAPAKAAKQSM